MALSSTVALSAYGGEQFSSNPLRKEKLRKVKSFFKNAALASGGLLMVRLLAPLFLEAAK